MQALVFCNNINSAQVIFELIRRRMFAGIVIPSYNKELILKISESGYINNNILFTPDPDADHEIVEIINKVKPDIGLVFTFPKILSADIIKIPKFGFYNFHYGLVPHYRSGDPVFWQIKNRESYAGVSVIKIDNSIDGGPLAMQEKIPIEAYDTYGVLLQKLVALACQMLSRFIDDFIAQKIDTKLQKLKNTKYLPKPQLNSVTINWNNMSMLDIIATINAGNPWNKGAICEFEGDEFRIVQASPAKYDKELPDIPGKIILANQQYGIFVICKNRELLRIDTIHNSQGYFSGGMILCSGIKEGKLLT